MEPNETSDLGVAVPELPDVRMERFVAALLETGTIRAACEAAGVSYVTGKRWMAAGPVKDAVTEARRELMRLAMTKLAAAVTEAIDALRDCMAPGVNVFARVQAASALLSTALKASDILDVDERLAALEKERDERERDQRQSGHLAGGWQMKGY